MSAIPPNWLGSIIQGHAAQQRASEIKQRESVADDHRVAPPDFADKLQEVIEISDADDRVFADAEGAGGQGRAFSEHEKKEQPDLPAAAPAKDGGLDITG